jgi:hypothetical protein
VLRSKRPKQLVPLLALVLATMSVGCGPFGYLKKVAKESSKAVAEAEAAQAEENAPYEYWGAVTYLEQSKILMGYSEYERSFNYGERAKQLAVEAKDKAEKRRAGKLDIKSDTLPSEGQPPADGAAATPAAPAGEATGSANATGTGGEVKAGVSVGGGGK